MHFMYSYPYLSIKQAHIDKVWMYEEMMTNDDNLESNLLTFSLLKIHSLVQILYSSVTSCTC